MFKKASFITMAIGLGISMTSFATTPLTLLNGESQNLIATAFQAAPNCKFTNVTTSKPMTEYSVAYANAVNTPVPIIDVTCSNEQRGYDAGTFEIVTPDLKKVATCAVIDGYNSLKVMNNDCEIQ